MRYTLLILILALSACTGPNHTFDLTKPLTLDMNPPEGPAEYKQGWVDGCTTGLASTNTKLFLALGSHKFTLDEHLRKNFLYNTAWRHAFNHCGYSMKTLAQLNF